MYFLTIAGVVNVILNVFFVIALNMHVDGVAWATVISQYLSMALIVISLSKTHGPIQLFPRQIRIEKSKLAAIVRIGLPAGLQSLLFSISNVLIQSAVNSFGSVVVAANAAGGNVEGFIGTTMNAYYNAAITYTGQKMGAKDYDGIDMVARVSTVFVFATWIILGGFTMLFGPYLLGFYTTDPQVIEVGMLRLNIMMAVYFTCAIMNVFPGLTRAMGYSILPMLSTLFGACIMRIVWLMTVFKWYPTVTMLFMVYPVTWTIAGAGQVAIYFYARRQIRKRPRTNSQVLLTPRRFERLFIWRMIGVHDYIQRMRETLHQNPEVAFAEHKTAELVASELRKLGFTVKTGVGKTGVVGTLSFGGRALRGSALYGCPSIEETTGADFRPIFWCYTPVGTIPIRRLL